MTSAHPLAFRLPGYSVSNAGSGVAPAGGMPLPART
jgi:hypothetical protein